MGSPRGAALFGRGQRRLDFFRVKQFTAAMPPRPDAAAPRVTLRMIAERAGLSLTAGSFALRNNPKIPAATRQRVRRAAEELGYRPDPQIAKLMHHLRARRAPAFQSTLAALTTIPEESRLPYIQEIVRSARGTAESLGYKLQLLTMEEAPEARPDLQRMLLSRGVEGILLLPLRAPRELGRLLEWSKFAVVATTYAVLAPEFHRVVPHQFNNMLTLCRELMQRGYRRIGLVEPAQHDRTVNRSFSAAVTWQSFFGGTEPVLPLIYEGAQPLELKSWFARERPDVIIGSGDADGRAMARELGLRIPGPVGFASANKSDPSIFAGMEERPADIGAAAVRLLASLLQHGEKGIPAVPTVTMVKGEWIDGRSVRARRDECASRSVDTAQSRDGAA